MLRTAARFLGATILAAALLVPAVPAAAAPADGGGWFVALLDAMASLLPTVDRVTVFDGGEALPNIDPNGLTTGAISASSSSTGEGGETYPNLDPNGVAGNPAGPQSQTAGGQEDTYPNIDPDG